MLEIITLWDNHQVSYNFENWNINFKVTCKQAGEIPQFCFNYQDAGLKKNNPQRLTYVDVNSSSSIYPRQVI